MSSLAIRSGIRSARSLPAQSVSRYGAQQKVFKRFAHDAHAPHEIFPFTYNNRKAFAVKCMLYMGTGFSIPFVAVWWQIHKHSAKASA